MKKLVEAEAFTETAEFSGNQYGTTKQAVQQVLDSGTVHTRSLHTVKR
jgi:guanylate kinase